MKRVLLGFAVVLFAFPVFAQEANVITIIREDGSKEVIPLGGTAQPAPEPAARAPTVEVKTRPAPKNVPQAEFAPVVPTIERRAEPVSAPKPKVAKTKPKAAAKPQAKAKARPQEVLACAPPRKPHRRVMPSGEPITKDRALYIALAEAPPSRDVQVYNVQGDQGAAYSVLFKTEEGAYEVLVDAGSGVILNSGAVQVEKSYVKPGHLPVRPVPY